MSASSTSPTATATDSGVSSSATSASASSFSNPGMFYKNLFYILIGLLCAFAFVSFLSLARARKRRHAILREAERLGVIVPGIPGYIPMRDRASLIWTRADGSSDPDWWEVVNKEKEPSDVDVNGPATETGNEKNAGRQRNEGEGLAESSLLIDQVDMKADELRPLSLIPAQHTPPPAPPVPQSTLPYFPNHLAYRPETVVPPTARFASLHSDPDALNKLAGEHVQVVTIVRMPVPPSAAAATPAAKTGGVDGGEDDAEGVLREWGGIELGIMSVKVKVAS